MIYTIENRGNCMLQVMRKCFDLDNIAMKKVINQEFEATVKLLREKGIEYKKLKTALVPNQDKGKKEIAFIFDSMKIDNGFYGGEIFKWLLPLFPKTSTFSVLVGDYIEISGNEAMQPYLKDNLFKDIVQINETVFRHSEQYYIAYLNSVTQAQINFIIEALKSKASFIGYIDLTYTSQLKSYLSFILVQSFIIHQDNAIMGHEVDLDDEENVNGVCFPFEENGFIVKSINNDRYGLFLSYKIESLVPDLEDVKYSLNALCIQFESLDKYDFVIEDSKLNYLFKEKNGLMEALKFKEKTIEDIKKAIYEKINENYIYNLDYLLDSDTIKFNVCIEMSTVNGHLRKTTIALEYIPESNKLRLITIT